MSNKINIPDINKKIDNCRQKNFCDKFTSSKRKSACQELKNSLTKIFDRKDIVLGDYDIPLVKKYFDNFSGCSGSGPAIEQCVKTHGKYMNIYKNLVEIDRDLDDLGDDINIIETLENNLRHAVTKELNDKLLDPEFDPTNNMVEIRCTGETGGAFCNSIIKYLYMFDLFDSRCNSEPYYSRISGRVVNYTLVCTEWSEFNKIIANSANKIDPWRSRRNARENFLNSFFKTDIYVDKEFAEFSVRVPYNNYNY